MYVAVFNNEVECERWPPLKLPVITGGRPGPLRGAGVLALIVSFHLPPIVFCSVVKAGVSRTAPAVRPGPLSQPSLKRQLLN